MARQFQLPYEPELNKLPMSPHPGGDATLSFKTNVNRSKTKRWVEAKKYSYDGNDWGEDEYGEYDDDDDETPSVQQSACVNQSVPEIPATFSQHHLQNTSMPAKDRSRSVDQVSTLKAVDVAASRSRSAEAKDRTVPIVRPAEIYERLREDPAERSQDPGIGQATSNSTDPISKGSSPGVDPRGDPLPSDEKKPESPALQLPDVKRISSFGTNFMEDSDPSTPKETTGPPPAPQEHQLRHSPSLGFTSVVHQAFDVPETPTTAVDSVARSNSNSTSVISPIIGHQSLSDAITPTTIVEEPESTSPPRGFKPGHRRDLSVPSPGNSPSRKPDITSHDGAPPSALAELSSNIPDSIHTPSPDSHAQSSNVPELAPLKIGDNLTSMPNETASGPIPVIVPSMSTDNSPQDTENDRLRKEIIRSLSRENTPSDEPEPQDGSVPPTSRQDSLVPGEYEKHWNEESSPSALEPKPVPIPIPQPQESYSSSPLPTPAPAPVPALAPAPQSARPKLSRKFSWESSSSEEPVPPTDLKPVPPAPVPESYPQSSEISHLAPMPGQYPPSSGVSPPPEPTVATHDAETGGEEAQRTPEKPKLTLVTPGIGDRRSIGSVHLPEVVDAEPAASETHVEESCLATSGLRTPGPPNSSSGPTPLGFREILGKSTSAERVRAFNQTREQFSCIDTGLSYWIRVTMQAHPEHMDVVGKSPKLSTGESKPSGSRGKFPKLGSLGTFAHPDPSGSGSGHTRRPSAPLGGMMNKQQVEQRGKDLLHTAGVLGGQAGKTAKSLFAKGRSKFKGDKEG
ncbi:hypothetical protein EYZ11_006561 [Aspergillus tanneri]|uniref:Uncharacterized protein n=1 Tax=Aspergillus tanneri TaxID=1220188 RepID=A0A4S3JFI4_9EURO|nr:hypothetical protein EYZ11_006561 [Aspergillus tanneri]